MAHFWGTGWRKTRKVITEANLDIRGTIAHKSMQILAYADNVVIVQRYKNAVKDAFNRQNGNAKNGVND
jgi:hypothetical protein